MRNFHQHGIDTRGRISGKIKTICPQCNDTRGHKGNKSLSVDLDKGLCYCHHCGYKLYVPDDAEERLKQQRRDMHRKPAAPPQHFRRPTFDPARMQLSESLERYWTTVRCLPQELLRTLRITEETVRLPESNQEENCICFNYFESGELVNTKFRSGQKHFKMVKDAELIPYNIDSILDTPECIITEGEMDAASFVTIGRRDVVSVPSGANSNLTWLDRFIPTHFEDKKTIYIAVDEDSAGLKLRDELLRRLGTERCRIVHFGPGCKDANEHLAQFGAESLGICIEQAEEIPLEGVFTAEELAGELRALYENGMSSGAETGWENFDKYCTLELQRLLLISGRPGDGKSEWLDELVMRLCLRHQWKVAYFSPENMPIVYHHRKLIEKLTGFGFNPSVGMTEELYQKSVQFLTENVCHILPGDEDYSIDTILQKARGLVVRKGIRILVIDPLNRIDQRLPPGQTELQYLSSLLNSLSRFATHYHCLVILVAHPRKMNRNPLTGVTPCVGMYDIFGSSDFYNKADFGIIVERDDQKGLVTIHVEKVKFKHLGTPGNATFVYNIVNGRYSPCEEGAGDKPGPINTQFDNKAWI